MVVLSKSAWRRTSLALRTPFRCRAPQTAHTLPELRERSWRCHREDSPHHSGLGIGLGSEHRVICFSNTSLNCSSPPLSSLLRQALLMNTASLNISGSELLPHVRSAPTWLPHVQVLCFLCMFSAFLQCGGEKGAQWGQEACVSQPADSSWRCKTPSGRLQKGDNNNN